VLQPEREQLAYRQNFIDMSVSAQVVFSVEYLMSEVGILRV
jgi:hypothetical protein